MRRHHAGRMWFLAALASAPLAAHAAEPKAESSKPEPASDVDGELLEFLGSIGAEDADWIDFLSQTDAARETPGSDRKPAPERAKNDGK
jgi:hypothetical protein